MKKMSIIFLLILPFLFLQVEAGSFFLENGFDYRLQVRLLYVKKDLLSEYKKNKQAYFNNSSGVGCFSKMVILNSSKTMEIQREVKYEKKRYLLAMVQVIDYQQPEIFDRKRVFTKEYKASEFEDGKTYRLSKQKNR